MKKVYFHIDEVARDSVVAANLKPLFAKQGIKLVYGNRLTSEGLKYAQPFDLLIFPSVDLLETICLKPERVTVPVMILPTEGIGMNTGNIRRFIIHFLGMAYAEGRKEWAEKVSAFCFWGEEQREGLARVAPELTSRFHVVGHPRYDDRCTKVHMQDQSSNKVGLLTRVDLLNTFDDRNVLHHLFSLRRVTGSEYWLTEGKDIEDIIYTMSSDARVSFNIMDSFKKEKRAFQLRIHPRENRKVWDDFMQTYQDVGTVAQWDQPFMHWLNSVGHIVSPPSTSFYDIFTAGKKPISYELMNPRRKNHYIAGSDDENPILKYVHMPETISDIHKLLNEPIHLKKLDPEVQTLLHRETNYPYSKKSLDVLVKLCVDHLQVSQSQTDLKAILEYNMRSRIRNMRYVFKNKIQNKSEQSAMFDLSAKRADWIDRLAQEPGV